MQSHPTTFPIPNTAPILVIGATGKTGRRIVQRLRQQGHAVREGARQSAVPFDWDQPQTWPAALQGVQRAFIAYAPDLGFAGAADKITALTHQAAAAGLQQLVLLSGRNEAGAQRCERIVQASGLGHTLVRASWFNQNFSEGALLAPVLAGLLALPAGDVREPFVDADDIADVAVAALTDRRHLGRTYELTGPQLLGFADVAAALATATGRAVQYLPVSPEVFRDAMAADVGPALAAQYTTLCREVFDGRNACLADGVQQVLGRAPRDFGSFCRAAAAAGAWRAAAATA